MLDEKVEAYKFMKPVFKCFDNAASVQTATAIINGEGYTTYDLENVRTILDIGANIGAAAVLFNHAYPDAIIHCFEPCIDSFKLLSENTHYISNISVHNYGLHEIDATVPLYKGKIDTMLNSIIPCASVSDECTTIQLKSAATEIKRLEIPSIDIIKIDTEGCEVPILRSLVKWLNNVKVIYIEYHSELDRLLIDVILRKTHVLFKSNVVTLHRGELTYFCHALEPQHAFELIES